MPSIQTFLTTNQAAKLLNVSLSTLKKFIYEGRLKTIKTPGGHHRIAKSSVLSLAKDNPYNNGSNESIEVVEKIIQVFEKRTKSRFGHAQTVAGISQKIAKNLGLSSSVLKRLKLAALAHDIGMIGISDSIINKPGSLTQEEYSIIKTHPIIGEEITLSIKPFNSISNIIRQHHERFDGTGYPDRLRENNINREAQIIALAESYAVMTSENSYKLPLSKQQALKEVQANSGSQFSPEVVSAFLEEYQNE